MPMKKVCPRCGATFECMHDRILSCHCATVRLNEQQRAYLQKNFPGGLCHDCLTAVKEGIVMDVCDAPLCDKQKNNDKKSIDCQ